MMSLVSVGLVSVGSVSGALVLTGMLGTTWFRDRMGMLDRPDMRDGTMRASDIRVRVAGISLPNARPAMPAALPIPTVLPGPPAGPSPGIGDPHVIPIAAAVAGVRIKELWQAHQSILVRIHPAEESRRLLLVLFKICTRQLFRI
jgi:hypothetical protein